MSVFTTAEQVILQIIIGFSTLNVVFMLTLNQEKSFSKLWGICFLTPFTLGLFGIFYPDSILKRTFFSYMDLSLLFDLLVVIWY